MCSLNIVLVCPVIPQNTGNIGRLTAATKSYLHLIKPLGFELTDRYLKRAGLDYWPEVTMSVYENWNEFLTKTGATHSSLWFFSTKASRFHWDVDYSAKDFLVFGSETKGLAKEYHEMYADSLVRIPFENKNVRSLNLANSAAIALYEARRQLRSTQ